MQPLIHGFNSFSTGDRVPTPYSPMMNCSALLGMCAEFKDFRYRWKILVLKAGR